MIEKIDVICPIYFLNLQFFKSNVESWLRELPINKLIVGINYDTHNAMLFENEIELILKEKNIEVIKSDHKNFKTLGYCLADLMKKVETKWFAFVHSDVELTEYCYNLMKPYMKPETGIIESARKLYDGDRFKDSDTHFAKRSYSGFQIFQTKVFKKFVETIEDDYIYRNEDFIFRNVCEREGFKYVKSWAMHYHQVSNNNQWSTERQKTYEQQWKGLIKYAIPDPICLDACIQAFGISIKEFKVGINELLEFAEKTNPEWKQKLFEFFTMELISKIYYNKL